MNKNSKTSIIEYKTFFIGKKQHISKKTAAKNERC